MRERERFCAKNCERKSRKMIFFQRKDATTIKFQQKKEIERKRKRVKMNETEKVVKEITTEEREREIVGE